MAKCRGPRKGIKRPPRRPQAADHDGELAELASVIAEYSLDNNASGWFHLPWRDGWNAVELATEACCITMSPSTTTKWLEDVCERREATQDIYWTAQELLTAPSGVPLRMHQAALRCLQMLIAKSDGGGEVYNAILVRPFSGLLPEEVQDLVLEYRCRDSIGTTARLQGDANDRQRRAFSIAWNRGLYLAAYALPSAIKLTSKLIIVKEPK